MIFPVSIKICSKIKLHNINLFFSKNVTQSVLTFLKKKDVRVHLTVMFVSTIFYVTNLK